MQEAGALQEELELTDDVDLAVYHMRNLPGEVRDRFTSDMGFVADYLNEGSFEGRKNQPIRHMEALCAMMEALTGDARFTEQINELMSGKEEKEEVYMCEYIDMLEARGEARGESRLAALLSKLYSLGRDEDVKLAVNDEAERTRLYEELCMVN